MGARIKAKVVRIAGGLCWADPGDGREPIQCLARGKVKKRAEGVMVGDEVMVSLAGDDATGVLEEVLPRRNQLARPAVANCDQAVVVCSVSQPSPNVSLVERILVQALARGQASSSSPRPTWPLSATTPTWWRLTAAQGLPHW